MHLRLEAEHRLAVGAVSFVVGGAADVHALADGHPGHAVADGLDHAGAVRTLLANINAGDPVNRIAALRARLSGADDERPLLTPTTGYNFVPTDANGLTYRRTPQQVLRIVYGTASAGVPRGLFFPNGMNGTLRVT